MTPICVVIPTRNRPKLLASAVNSVLACDYPEFNVLVIDQSSSDASEQVLSDIGDPRLKYVHLDKIGAAPARNLGMKLATTPIIAFTDDDCRVPPDWLKSIDRALEDNPDVDMVYGETRVAEDLVGEAGVVPHLLFDHEERIGGRRRFRIAGMTANLAMRRCVVQTTGGFDEVLGAGGPLKSAEDFDLQYRAYRAGVVTLLSPAIWVDHYGIKKDSEWATTLTSYGFGDGAFYLKHVRCGDFFALMLLTKILLRGALREILIPIRPRPSLLVYWRSFLSGMRASMRFKIDKSRRIYESSEGAHA
jgi:GT2 family glycosyltransferase